MNGMKWQSGLAVVLMASMIGAVGCSTAQEPTTTPDGAEQGPDAVQELNLTLGDEIPTMDLSKAVTTLSYSLLNATMEGLVRQDPNGQIQPGIAKSWDISADGLTYTFHLRSDAKWWNGDPVTAHDFAYSWKRTLNPLTKAENADVVAWIKGGTAYALGKGSAEDVGIKVVDNQTLQVQLETPKPHFLAMTGFSIFFPQNQKFVEAAGEKYGSEADKFLGNGPFKLTSWLHEASATLEKNASYWDAASVKLQKVTFTMVRDSHTALNLYESGQIDMTSLLREQIDRFKSSPELLSMTKEVSSFLPYNLTNPVLKNKKIRQALAYSIDAQSFVDVVLGNGSVPATSLTPAGVKDGAGGEYIKGLGDAMQRKQRASQAKTLLQEGMRELGLQAPPKIRYLADDSSAGRKGAEFLKEQWLKHLGLDVELDIVPPKMRIQKMLTRDYDIGTVYWNPTYSDAMAYLELWVTTGSYNTAVGWSNADYDALLLAANREADAKKRTKHLQDAERILLEELPVAPLYWSGTQALLKPYVKGLVLPSSGFDYELKWTWIEGKK